MNSLQLIKLGNNLDTLYLHAEKGEYLDPQKNGFTQLSLIERVFRVIMSFLYGCCVESYKSVALTHSLKALKTAYESHGTFQSDSTLDFRLEKNYSDLTPSHLSLITDIREKCREIQRKDKIALLTTSPSKRRLQRAYTIAIAV